MLPENVTTLLKLTRFVHLGTCHNNVPHLALMNYTYYRDGDSDVVIMLLPRLLTKMANIEANPEVALLIHDWISAKDNQPNNDGSSSRRNSLYEMLANINKNEISRVSVQIQGQAEILDPKDARFSLYKLLHLNNAKIDTIQAKNYIEHDNENALIVIKVDGCKVTDTMNNTEEYST